MVLSPSLSLSLSLSLSSLFSVDLELGIEKKTDAKTGMPEVRRIELGLFAVYR